MLIGIAADAHDHVGQIRSAVGWFNASACDAVVFAGDFVSPIAIPPWRALRCPLVACFGDNEGNRVAIEGGLRVVGTVGEPPFGHTFADGSRLLLTHRPEDLPPGDPDADGHDWVVVSHTHRPSVGPDDARRVVVNPGELCGWVTGRSTVATYETRTAAAGIVELGPVDRGR